MISWLKKRVRRWERHVLLTKRQQFVGITLILTSGLLLTQLVTLEWRYTTVLLLALLAFVGSAIGLREDLKGIEWLTLLLLPTLYTAAVALFYFLLPVRWLTRVPAAVLYAIGMYALLLTENIYNVAADRSIALLRAAHSVGFLLTLVTYFLLVSALLAFHLNVFLAAFMIALITFFLALQSLWAMELEEEVSGRVWRISSTFGLAFFQLAWVFSFWPVRPTLFVLFLTTCFYSSVGMAQQYLAIKLYRRTVIEFFSVVVLVLFIILFATHWRGNFP